MTTVIAHPVSAPPAPTGVTAKVLIFLALAALTAAACLVFKPAPIVSESGVVMRWPDKVFDYTGRDEKPSHAELTILPPDTEFAKKTYADAGGDALSTQIVLSGVEHRSIHRPEKCLEGQGWSVRNGQVIKVPLKSGRNLDVMVLDITRPVVLRNGATVDLPALYAYFFVSKDTETARHLDRLAITNLDLLLHNKAHRWAYVIFTAQITKGLVPNGPDREQALDLIKNFIRETAPTFLKSEGARPGAKQTPS